MSDQTIQNASSAPIHAAEAPQKYSVTSVTFDNSHAGTYVVECEVQYQTTIDGKTEPVKRSAIVAGGRIAAFNDIPLDATHLNIYARFRGGEDFHFPIPNSKTPLPPGLCTVDLRGVWPWGGSATLSIHPNQ
jgi:hypothetical protein